MTIENMKNFIERKNKVKSQLRSALKLDKASDIKEISLDSDSSGNLWMTMKAFTGKSKKALVYKGRSYKNESIIKKDRKYTIKFIDAYYSMGRNVLAKAYLNGKPVKDLSAFGDSKEAALKYIKKDIMTYSNY